MKLHHAAILAVQTNDCKIIDSIVNQLREKCNFNYAQVCDFFQAHTGIDANDLDAMIQEGEANNG